MASIKEMLGFVVLGFFGFFSFLCSIYFFLQSEFKSPQKVVYEVSDGSQIMTLLWEVDRF